MCPLSATPPSRSGLPSHPLPPAHLMTLGRMHWDPGSDECPSATTAPFTVRIQSSKQLRYRSAPASQGALLNALSRALTDTALPGLHTTVVDLDGESQLVIREGAGAAVAVVLNYCKSTSLRLQMLLHGAAEGAVSSTRRHVVPPASQMVVDAIKALDNADYENNGMETGC